MKKIKFLKISLLSILFLTVQVLIGQKTNPQYTYKMNSQVKWMMLTESGTLVASTGSALIGIYPNSSNVSFAIDDINGIPKENVQSIANTPYLLITSKGAIKKVWVVDVIAGKLVFSSKAENWKNGVYSKFFIYPDKLVVNGMHKEKGLGQYRIGVGLYSLISGKLIQIFERKANNAMSGRPDILDDKIIIPGLKTITSYSISTGKEIWQAKVKNANSIITNTKTQEIYAFAGKKDNSVVYKVNSEKGNLLWAEGNKLKGTIARTEFTDKGLAILTNVVSSKKSGLMKKLSGNGTSKIYFLDLKSGKDLWAKTPKAKTFINHFYIEDDGILFGMSGGGINKIGFDGTPRWKHALKTGPGIQIMAKVPKGILYISQTDTDIVDENTGESVFGKKLKYKNSKSVASAYDKDKDRYLVSCKDGIYELSGNTGAYSLLTSDVGFEGKEAPSSMTLTDTGILLTSNQNLAMFTFDGEKQWHTYYKAPGISGVGKFFAAVTAISSFALASGAAYRGGQYKAALGSYHSETRRMDQYSKGFSNIASASFKALGKRFTATKATKNNAFILTKLSGGVGLVNVDKSTGKKVAEIVLNNKKPEYEIDDVEGLLYYKSNGSTIHCFKLNK